MYFATYGIEAPLSKLRRETHLDVIFVLSIKGVPAVDKSLHTFANSLLGAKHRGAAGHAGRLHLMIGETRQVWLLLLCFINNSDVFSDADLNHKCHCNLETERCAWPSEIMLKKYTIKKKAKCVSAKPKL